MIAAGEVLRTLRLPAVDEGEVQRIGSEIAGLLRDPNRFDGRPVRYEISTGEDEEQQARSFRIACALQRRFQSKDWAVYLEPFVDPEAGDPYGAKVHRLTLTIDVPAVMRDGTREQAPVAATFSLRLVYEELGLLYGTAPGVKSTSEKPVLSVLLGTYNRLVILQKMIASVRSSVGDLSYEIIVTDGGSTDGTRAWLAAQPDVLLVGERRLEGAVKAFNQAYALSRGEFVANLNDDCVVHGRALADGVEHLQKNLKCGQVAFAFSGAGQPKRGINDIYGVDSPKPASHGTTYANFGVVRRSVADQVAYIQGGFWNPCYRTYAGDCEFSAWVWKLAHSVDKRPDLYVEDVWAEDGLRAKNKVGSGAEARLMYERWNDPEMFKPDGPLPNVSAEEIERYRIVQQQQMKTGDGSYAPVLRVRWFGSESEVDVSKGIRMEVRAEAPCFFPLPEEETRLRALASRIRALDPVENQFPEHAEKLSEERVLHIGLGTNVDPQAGLERALTRFGFDNYREVKWFADYREDAQARVDAVLKVAAEQRPTFVFLQTMQGAFDGAFVKKLREVADPSCVIVTWSGDIAYDHSPWNLDGHVELARAVDVAFHSSMSHVRILRAAGAHNAAYLQIGYDPEQYRPPLRALVGEAGKSVATQGSGGRVAAEIPASMLVERADDLHAVAYGDWRAKFRSYDVAFLGSHYGGDDAFSSSVRWHDGALRDEVVAKMKEAFGWKFSLYGRGWGKGAREISLARAHEVYQRSKIGLSVSLMNDLECYSSDRLHRILGCGALLLVKRFPMMGVWGLKSGENCIVWDTADEAVSAAKLCLDEKTDFIRRAGAELAREHLSWDVRMLELKKYVDAVREMGK